MEYKFLHKKFSIAVSFGLINVTEYCKIIAEFADYIHDIYFSPTESLHFQTRHNVYDFKSTTDVQRKEYLDKVISLAKQLNIKTGLTLNSSMLDRYDAFETFKSYYGQYKFDFVTTTMPIARLIKQSGVSIDIICSYNEGISSFKKLQQVIDSGLFTFVVLGNKFLRSFQAFHLLDKAGIKSILMLNTGCSAGCVTFCNNNDKHYCLDLFNNTVDKNDINEVYAHQSIFPEELKEYSKHGINIDVFKLASRPITYEELHKLILSYITEDSVSYIKQDIKNYHLYARLAHYTPYYSALDYSRIIAIKNQIWNCEDCNQ